MRCIVVRSWLLEGSFEVGVGEEWDVDVVDGWPDIEI